VDVHVFDWVVQKMVEDHKVRLYAFPRQLMESVRATHTLVIISGSPDMVVRPFVEQFKADYIFGSTFEQQDGKYTGVAAPVGDKAAILQRLVDEGQGTQEGSLAIGDTMSDRPMLSWVEQPIMFNASRTLTEHGKELGWLRVNEVKDCIAALQFEEAAEGYREIEYPEILTTK
jgi:phosphoserine phosphatase